MGKVYPVGTNLRVLDGDGRIVWSTDRRPVNLLPQAAWLSVPLTVAYPDFIKRNAYAFDIGTSESSGLSVTSCASWSTIIPGEWGMGEASPRNLPQIALGTVPTGVDYIDVRVTLNRTKSPTNYLAFVVQNHIPTQETYLPGGSCLAESTLLWRRTFDIVLDATTVYLRRKQSVLSAATTVPWTPDNAVYYPSGGKREGWTHGGGSGSANGHLAQLIEGKGPGGNVNKERGGSNACSLTDNTDFSSTWTGTALIRPGYLAA